MKVYTVEGAKVGFGAVNATSMARARKAAAEQVPAGWEVVQVVRDRTEPGNYVVNLRRVS